SLCGRLDFQESLAGSIFKTLLRTQRFAGFLPCRVILWAPAGAVKPAQPEGIEPSQRWFWRPTVVPTDCGCVNSKEAEGGGIEPSQSRIAGQRFSGPHPQPIRIPSTGGKCGN